MFHVVNNNDDGEDGDKDDDYDEDVIIADAESLTECEALANH